MRGNPREERERYSRQILFSGRRRTGATTLLDARVAVAGCGALGSFQAGALARAGVGFVRIIDRDYVELSNLQRQWLVRRVRRGAGPAQGGGAAARKIAGHQRDIQIEPLVADLTAENVGGVAGRRGIDSGRHRQLRNALPDQ
jgi:molybdopterin-synthase adenylyltransferase